MVGRMASLLSDAVTKPNSVVSMHCISLSLSLALGAAHDSRELLLPDQATSRQ